ncbi:MAG: AI-2E family transporter [Gallionella sp.]|jgi:predicted PurR-regulated permease PerM
MSAETIPSDTKNGTPAENKIDAEDISQVSVLVEESAAITIRTTRYLRMNVSLGILAVIALVAALYLARAFFVPLLIGILASYTLSPVVEWLKAWYIPRSVGAALVLAVLMGGLSWIAFSLSDDGALMIERLPEAVHKFRKNLNATLERGPATLRNMQQAAKELQGAANELQGSPAEGPKAVVVVRPSEPTTWLRDYALAQSALLVTIAAQTPIILLLTYFLLASGAHFRRKLVQFVGPSLSRKKDAVRILDEIDIQIQRYLLTMLISNVLVGVCTWLAFETLGMGQPGVWGVIAGVLHFIPYLGPALVAFTAGIAGFLQFGSLLQGLLIAGTTLVISGAVGLGFTTWLQSRFARVNAAVLFITLLFFGWLWGVWGMLLGAPLVAIVKVICDRVESLKPIGELLGR